MTSISFAPGVKDRHMPSPALTDRLVRLLRRRRLVRAPIALYRAGLGVVLGRRFLMLEHCGRRTGEPRSAVLEVVSRPAPDRVVVASALGERAQWWHNVLAHPQVRIWTGTRRAVPATARPLPPHEVAEQLGRYAREHPRAWRTLEPLLRRTLGLPPEADVAEHARLIEFHLAR
jgi:deazaflavin-dependent oxidoreductase (nitroreductase family)